LKTKKEHSFFLEEGDCVNEVEISANGENIRYLKFSTRNGKQSGLFEVPSTDTLGKTKTSKLSFQNGKGCLVGFKGYSSTDFLDGIGFYFKSYDSIFGKSPSQKADVIPEKVDPTIPEESIDESSKLSSTEVFGRTTTTFFDAPPSSKTSYVNRIFLGYSDRSKSFDFLTFTSLDSANGSLSKHKHYGDKGTYNEHRF
jgi:hypothetical protein